MRTTESAAIIRYVKRAKNKTNKDIAEMFGIHENTVYSWTAGKQRPCYDDIMMILDTYQIQHDFARIMAAKENT